MSVAKLLCQGERESWSGKGSTRVAHSHCYGNQLMSSKGSARGTVWILWFNCGFNLCHGDQEWRLLNFIRKREACTEIFLITAQTEEQNKIKRESRLREREREGKTGKRKSINMLASAKLKNLASLVYAHNMIFFIFYFRALRQGKVKSE